jgi:putative membrane protein
MTSAAIARSFGEARARTEVVEQFAMGVLYVWTALAIAGFALVRFWPSVIAADPNAARIYAISFTLFARVHVLLAGSALLLVLSRRAGTRWIPAFVAVYLVSLTSELAGTTTGLPFGAYSYTDALGWKWLGEVPALIPLSWFYMVLPSYALAARSSVRGPVARVALASLILLAWDLALDPAMSHASSYWVWGDRGAYYGMPLLNLFGWYLTGVALAAVLETVRARQWLAGVPARWLAGFYGANLLLPLGLCAVAGMWGAVALTCVVIGLIAVVVIRAPARGGA